MEDRLPWLAVLDPLAKLIAAAGLFAYLLRRGGLRPAAVTLVTLAHLMALFCGMPVSGRFMLVATVALGMCAYAVLIVDRPWLRASTIAACFLAFGALCAQASPMLSMVAIIPLALWTGFMVIIRDWARGGPEPLDPPAAAQS